MQIGGLSNGRASSWLPGFKSSDSLGQGEGQGCSRKKAQQGRLGHPTPPLTAPRGQEQGQSDDDMLQSAWAPRQRQRGKENGNAAHHAPATAEAARLALEPPRSNEDVQRSGEVRNLSSSDSASSYKSWRCYPLKCQAR